MRNKVIGFLIGFCAFLTLFQISAFATNPNLVSKEKNGIFTEIKKDSLKQNLQSVGSTNLPKLTAPTVLKWHENGTKGYISWNAVPESEGEYNIIVYKNNSECDDLNWTGLFPAEGSTRVGIDYSYAILDSGSYTFKVAATGDNINNVTSDYSTLSSTYTYHKPQNVLGVPTNVSWDSENPTVAMWDSVPNAWGYYAELFLNGQSIGASWGEGTSVDFLDWMYEPGIYTFRVRALSNNIEQTANGTFSSFSEEYNTDIAGQINSSLTDLINDYQNGNTDADGILSNLQNINLDDLAVSMQTNDDVLSNIQTLEDAYASEKGITVTNNVDENISDRINSNLISVVGAAFNAGAGVSNMTLNFSPPNKEVVVDESQYKNVLQVNISLIGATSESLDVPVRITMPIPNGVSESKFTILHYHADGTYETIFPIEHNGDGTVSFTLTSFSTFVFAEIPFAYVDYGNEVYITRYLGDSANVLIPSQINGVPVGGIASYAFDSNANIISVIIPSSVNYIENNAFNGCINLAKVTFFGDTYISLSAFSSCNSFIINAFSGTSPYLYANDYGLNCVSLGEDLSYGTAIDQLSYASNTGEITANSYIANNTGNDENSFIILAVYDSNNLLISKSIETVWLKSNEVTAYTKTFNSKAGLSHFKVKAFLWQDTSSIMPKTQEYTKSY